MISEKAIDNLLILLIKNQPILIITHENPDGDALGAIFGLKSFLDNMGLLSSIYLHSSLPIQYRELMGAIKHSYMESLEEIAPQYKSLVFLDMADLSRSGLNNRHAYLKDKIIFNIDHHVSNTNFGEFNFVDTNWSSTCEGLARIFMFNKQGTGKDLFLPEVADLFLLGILTDTGYFSYPNVTEKTMETVGFLLRCGASISRVNLRVRENMTDGQFRAWGYALLHSNTDAKHGLIWSSIPNNVYNSLRLGEGDTEGIVEFFRNRKNCKLAILFKEIKPGSIRISLRSKGSIDVNQLASNWGGGGHPQAAGFTLKGELKSIEEEVLDFLRRHTCK